MDAKSEPKTEVWAIRGATFEVLGGILKSLILMRFRTAKSRLKIEKVGGLGRPTGAIPLILGRVGGQGGGHRRLLESDRNWQESDNASRTPSTPKKGGGSECAMRREHRRPRIWS